MFISPSRRDMQPISAFPVTRINTTHLIQTENQINKSPSCSFTDAVYTSMSMCFTCMYFGVM